MQVTQEQISPCEIELNIEIEAEKVKSAIDETYRELGKSVNIPGFRKGKAPRAIIEQFLDKERVKDQAADKLMQPAFVAALEETKIEPYALASVEVIKLEFDEPMVFKAVVPLAPKVELGDYTGLEVEKNVPEVKEEHIDEEIKSMLERYAKYTQITDRPTQAGDVVVIDMKDESQAGDEPKRNVVTIGENLPDFDNGLTGMNLEEEKVIDVSYPEDSPAEELRGKTVPIHVKIFEINEKTLPELTDEWVKESFAPKTEEGAEPPAAEDVVETVETLRSKIRGAMEKAAQDVANTEVENKLVDKIVANASVDFPGVMVEERVEERVKELAKSLKERQVTIEDYVKHTGTTAEELQKKYEEEARERIKIGLVLRAITEKENVTVEDADVDAELADVAKDRGVPVETMKAYLEHTDGLDNIKNRVLQKKLMDFLMKSSNIKSVG